MVRYFLYYIPGLTAGPEAKAKVVAAVGSSISGCDLKVRNVAGGPGQSGPGVLVAAVPGGRPVVAAEVERRLEYVPDPARQVWAEGAGFWVGYHVDLQPGPEDLLRVGAVDGYAHTCADTGDWIIPLARYVDGGTNFDERIVYRPDNEIEMKPLKRYERLCAFALEHFEMLNGLLDQDLNIVVKSNRMYADVAVEALAVNYHVGPYELSLLGVLTREASVLICGYLCDWPGLLKIMRDRHAEKKTESAAAESIMNSGGTAG